jgi:hypothetical protein
LNCKRVSCWKNGTCQAKQKTIKTCETFLTHVTDIFTHVETVLRTEILHVNILEKHEAQVNGELIHENMSINFIDVQLEDFGFCSSRGDVVHEIIPSDFDKFIRSNSCVIENVTSGEGYETPVVVLIPETQHDCLLLEVVFGRAFEEVWVLHLSLFD